MAGTKSLRVLLKGSGTEKEAVPLAAFTLNFSSIFFKAPPPLGSVIAGGCIIKLASVLLFSFEDESNFEFEPFLGF